MAAIVLLTNMTSAVIAQNTASQTIRGHVTDVASSEPMIGVTVVIDDMDGKGTVTDMDGNFIIEHVPVGRHSIRASYVGQSLCWRNGRSGGGVFAALNGTILANSDFMTGAMPTLIKS